MLVAVISISVFTPEYSRAYTEIGWIGNSDPSKVQICKALIQKHVLCHLPWFRNCCFLCTQLVNTKCHIGKRLGISAFVKTPWHWSPHSSKIIKENDARIEQSCKSIYIQTSQRLICGCPNENAFWVTVVFWLLVQFWKKSQYSKRSSFSPCFWVMPLYMTVAETRSLK